MNNHNNKNRGGSAKRSLIAALSIALSSYAALSGPVSAASDPGIVLEVTRFEISGNNPLSQTETDEVLARHLGAHRSLESLEAAATSLEQRLRSRGYSFHRVALPAQRPVAGVVRLEIIQFPLDQVSVTGARHFSEDNIRRSVPAIEPGSVIDVQQVARQLTLANEHPSKRVNLVLKESPTANAMNAELRVRDTSPLLYFASLTGHTQDRYDEINRNTGYTRLTLGFQHSNLFDRDHALTATYTTSPDHIEDVKQFGVFYGLPLYGLGASLHFHYLYSDINTGTIGTGGTSFDVSGSGEFLGVRATFALPKWGDFTQRFSVGHEHKRFSSNVSFSGTPLPQSDTQTRPITLRYDARTEGQWGSASAYTQVAFNTAGGSGNNEVDFGAVRTNAEQGWNAWQFGFDYNRNINNWTAITRLRVQHSGSLLIPGEQFGLGGVGSVRGLRDREFAGDSGYTVTLEGVGPQLVEGLRPAFFLDHGYAMLRDKRSVINVQGSESATSIGVGLRYNWNRQLDVTGDLAYVLDGTYGTTTVPGTPIGSVKLNFSAFYRF